MYHDLRSSILPMHVLHNIHTKCMLFFEKISGTIDPNLPSCEHLDKYWNLKFVLPDVEDFLFACV